MVPDNKEVGESGIALIKIVILVMFKYNYSPSPLGLLLNHFAWLWKVPNNKKDEISGMRVRSCQMWVRSCQKTYSMVWLMYSGRKI